MKRRAQAGDRECHDDECDCKDGHHHGDDKAGWIGEREEEAAYRDFPLVVDEEAHRLRAQELAKEAYLDRDMNPPFHNTAMSNTSLDNTTPPPDWPAAGKNQDPSSMGGRHVTPPPLPPPTSTPAVIDGPAYTWQEDQSSISEFSIADMAASAAAAGIYPPTTANPTTPPTTATAGAAPATPATEPRRRSYTKTAAGVEVIGEVVTGEGWRRHTRVYGGGVCLACLESERMRAAMGMDGPPGGAPASGEAVEAVGDN